MTSQQNLVCLAFLLGKKRRCYSLIAENKTLVSNYCNFKAYFNSDNDLIFDMTELDRRHFDNWLKNRMAFIINNYFNLRYYYRSYISNINLDEYNIFVMTKNYIPFIIVQRSEVGSDEFKMIHGINISDNREYNITKELSQILSDNETSQILSDNETNDNETNQILSDNKTS